MDFLAWGGVLTFLLAGLPATVSALQLDINSTQSLKDAATTTVFNMFSNSTLNDTVNPVSGDDDFTWNATLEEAWLYSILIPYWNATGNDTYNDLIRTRLDSKIDTQFGTSWDETDDSNMNHAAWGLAAVTAAELNFPGNTTNSWQTLAANVASTLHTEWMFVQTCSGGLVYSEQNTSIKESFSNGEYFQLNARLAYLTSGDDQATYANDAANVWDWSVLSELVDESDWTVQFTTMNTTAGANCTATSDQWRWTYQYGLYLSGAAYMYQVTGTEDWKTRAKGLLNTTVQYFFKKGVMVEGGFVNSAEVGGFYIDNNSEYTFRGLLASCLVAVAQLLPDTADTIVPLLQTTAKGAAKQCSGTSNGTVCGYDWTDSTYDQNPSFFASMSAASVFTANLRIALSSANKTTNGTSTDSASGSANGSSSSGLSGGDIAGIVVGSVAGGALIAAAAVLAWRAWRKKTPGKQVVETPPVTDDDKGKYQAAELHETDVAELPQGGGAYSFPEMDAGPVPQHAVHEMPAKTIRYELDA
ncbi:hypothetical protein BO71DRAFT_420471 [Aspergillus ellipticus CBS 707.79]|uniref:mannan endo-1,6-alpha-mannosidase n=1 Tax=Aspergillus ellipticus CBS 707.79 TaxID=1448320 RepID=A0A319DXJ3_9EURO|nr:hypothetical protein BO71DRAFT_420471 [Aspergillus ellipticus CBS 707.79]